MVDLVCRGIIFSVLYIASAIEVIKLFIWWYFGYVFKNFTPRFYTEKSEVLTVADHT